MNERVIPGVAFNEITEGLLGTPSPGAIGIKMVGTACKGPFTPQLFGTDELPKLIEMFGPEDPYHYKDGNASEPVAELTLVRAAKQIYEAGPPPGGLWVRRVDEGTVPNAVSNTILTESFSTSVEAAQTDTITTTVGGYTFTTSADGVIVGTPVAGDILIIIDVDGDVDHDMVGEYVIGSYDNGGAGAEIVTIDSTIIPQGFKTALSTETTNFSIFKPADDSNIRFTSKYPGQWYNNAQVEVENYVDLAGVANSGLMVFTFYVPSNVFYDSYIDPDAGNATERISLFRWYDSVIKVEVGTPDSTIAPTSAEVVTALQANEVINSLYDIALIAGSNNQERVKAYNKGNLLTGTDVGGANWNAADATVPASASINTALAELINKDGRFVVIAGADESLTGYQQVGISHAKTASLAGQDHECVFLTGTNNYATVALLVAQLSSNPYPLNEDRTVQVTPGGLVENIFYNKNYGIDYGSSPDPDTQVSLSGGYMAARVAGLASVYVPDESPLWKNLGLAGLEFEFTRTHQKIAINNSWFTLAKAPNNASIVKRAITSAGVTSSFYQFTTRVIVDELRYALRLSGLAFIGKKNTSRVRKIMEEKLKFVANQYVGREIILGDYTMKVTASRGQQILGVVKIAFAFKVVFFMEFIEFDLILE